MDLSSSGSLLSYFLQGAAIGIGAALSPGPFQSLVIAQALLGGWRRAAPVNFAPLIADIPIAVTLVFVISQVPDDFLRFVKFAGAALLVFLAWGLWRELRSERAAAGDAPRSQSPLKGLLQGALMLFLSPGSYLFWALVLGPLLLEALKLSMSHALVFLFSFYGFSIGGLLLIAAIVGRIGLLSPTGKRALQIGSLLLMLVIAATLIENGLRT